MIDRITVSAAALLLASVVPCRAAPSPVQSTNLYVSAAGSDAWSGLASRPERSGGNGPLATLDGARNRIRALRASGRQTGAIVVHIEPGTYTLSAPFTLSPQDSGSPGAPITYEGDAARRPIISGGREVSGIRAAGRRWIAPLRGEKAATEYSALWVNGERRTVARTPNSGFFKIVGLANAAPGAAAADDRRSFRFAPGDITRPASLKGMRVVVFHNWETSIHRVQSIDEASHTITFTGDAAWPFSAGERYYVENTPEALDTPGEWQANESANELSYIPRSGEKLSAAHFVVPNLDQLVLIKGDPRAGQFVQNVRFRNLRFFYTNYTIEPQGHSDGQAAVSVPAALQLTGARSCSVENCEIAHTANYGIWLRSGCQDDRIVHSELYDLGAGGVRIGETENPASAQEAAANNTVDNDFIHDDGRIFRGAVGVFIARSSGNTVSHNDIGDMDYTGISVGWSWGYDPSSANRNILEYNHIHDIGRGELSDMGAIYSLGVSPGTIERGNVMHDIYCSPGGYGGWGVYTDEGSSGILVENNLVFNTSSGCFHQHYGENNVLENNIFAYGVAGILQRTREETHNSFTFEHNLVVSNGTPFQLVGWSNGYFTVDHNLYWNYRDRTPRFFGMTLADWQAKGHDTHSIVADPRFTGGPPRPNDPILIGAKRSDFDIRPGSPAFTIGFVPFDTARAGLYGSADWTERPGRVPRARYYPPPPEPPSPIRDGFENTPVGARADGATTMEEGKGDSIRVTDETAAAGTHSLKFTDAPELEHRYNPHLFYSTHWTDGLLQEDVDLRIEAGCVMYHEWRDSASPYHVGPDFRVGADGAITSGGKAVGTVRAGQWMHVTLRCELGRGAAGHFSLQIRYPGDARVLSFENLPCSPEFKTLNWLGFSMDGDQHAVMYLDNLDVHPVRLPADSGAGVGRTAKTNTR